MGLPLAHLKFLIRRSQFFLCRRTHKDSCFKTTVKPIMIDTVMVDTCYAFVKTYRMYNTGSDPLM